LIDRFNDLEPRNWPVSCLPPFHARTPDTGTGTPPDTIPDTDTDTERIAAAVAVAVTAPPPPLSLSPRRACRRRRHDADTRRDTRRDNAAAAAAAIVREQSARPVRRIDIDGAPRGWGGPCPHSQRKIYSKTFDIFRI
jgi:hypothetical protein